MHSCVPFRRPFQAVAHRRVVHVSASAIAPPVSILKKDADGNCKGTTRLALKVADDATANGLVHRYMVMVLQNARRVSALEFCTYIACMVHAPLHGIYLWTNLAALYRELLAP